MREVFEKILERLEEEKSDWNYDYNVPIIKAIENVKNFAEEYNNGWITCSERLPEDDSICIVTVEYPNNEIVVDYGWFDIKSVCWFVGIQEFRTYNILAWQPLPEPYKK